MASAATTGTPARTYAKVVGVVVLLVGVIGLILGDPKGGFLGFNIDLVEDIVHLATGGLLAYTGFSAGDAQVKQIVMMIGVVYLIVGVIGFFLPGLFGLLPTEYALQDNLLHLVLGGLAVGAAKAGATTTARTA